MSQYPSTRVHTSRGGAGNISSLHDLHLAQAESASASAAAASTSTTDTPKFYSSGRGGAGNFHSSEHAIFSFDEELDLQLKHERRVAPIIHIGRGGAGNAVPQSTSARSSPGLSMTRNWSSSTAGSMGSGTSSEFEQDEKIKAATRTATAKAKTSSSRSSSSETSLKNAAPSRWSRFMGGFRS